MRLKTMLERRRLEQLELRLKHTHPQQKLNENRQILQELENRLRDRMQMLLEENKHRLAIYTGADRRSVSAEKAESGIFLYGTGGRREQSGRCSR